MISAHQSTARIALRRSLFTTTLLRAAIPSSTTTTSTQLQPFSSLRRQSKTTSNNNIRMYSSDTSSSMTPAESSIAALLASNETLAPTTSLLVRDVSGGCGSMYAIEIASPQFRGKNLLAQQRLVTKALGDKVKEWHGVQIRTSVPPEE